MAKKTRLGGKEESQNMPGFLSLEEVTAEEYFGTTLNATSLPKNHLNDAIVKEPKPKRRKIKKHFMVKEEPAFIQEETGIIEMKKEDSSKVLKQCQVKAGPLNGGHMKACQMNGGQVKAGTNSFVKEISREPIPVGILQYDYNFHEIIQRQLLKARFLKPTPIQERVFERILCEREEGPTRDVIGEAPTGSGKTLAFSLPIIDTLLRRADAVDSILTDSASLSLSKLTPENYGISALILVPTRELGLQVQEHLYKFLEGTCIRLVTLIGGISVVKQKRLLSKRIDILIATPGRLWSFIKEKDEIKDKKEEVKAEEENSEQENEIAECENRQSESSANFFGLKQRLESLQWLVLDEVDRMVETGHFKELFDIFKLLHATAKMKNNQRRTFVFSATLSSGKSIEASCDHGQNKNSKTKSKGISKIVTLANLIEKIPFQDKKPLYIHIKDLVEGSSATDDSLYSNDSTLTVVSSVQEFKLICQDNEKDIFLYYYLLRNSAGRKLIFVNSIDQIRRLVPFLKALGFPRIYAMHSQMDQKQRLRQLDQFKNLEGSKSCKEQGKTQSSEQLGSTNESHPVTPLKTPTINELTEMLEPVMICTDVLGRGIDIEKIDHVIHYQCPRSQEIYVHRAGRSGRGQRTFPGISLLLISQSEWQDFTKLPQSEHLLDLPKDQVPNTQKSSQEWLVLKERVGFAVELDKLQHEHRKLQMDKSWTAQVKETFEIEDENDINVHVSDKKRKYLREELEENATTGPLRQKKIVAQQSKIKTALHNSGVFPLPQRSIPKIKKFYKR